MDRDTRKANLKKLQLPKRSGSKQLQRKVSTQKLNSVISNYFVSPEKLNINIENREEEEGEKVTDKPNEPLPSVSPLENVIATRSKRTKLDDFIFKDSNNMPSSLKKSVRKSINDDDFVIPEKKVKKAPKLATSNSQAKSSKVSKAKKKQTTIKSAFLRNEQMFAEIAAQHCAADQFDGDDVQLALAISKSEAERRGIASPNEEAESVVEDIAKNADAIRDKLKRYGFRTAERRDYNTFAAAFLPKSKRLKAKWANKFTALTLRQSEIQLKKLQNNIEKLLNSRFRTKASTADEQYIPSYKLQSSLLRQSSVIGNKCIIYNLNGGDQPNELFFVKELFEIKVLPAGYLLKDWSAIQGRDLTPKVKSTRHKESLEKLENIYQELEEYFQTLKCRNWSDATQGLEQQIGSIEASDKETKQQMQYYIEVKEQNKQPVKVKENKEKTELDEMIELIEEMQKNSEEIENKVSDTTTMYNNKIKELLASTKVLDNMDVSSCSSKTQLTVNTNQKIRSNSPDLFADSDVEIEVEKEESDDKNKQNFVIKDASFKNQADNINTKVDNNIESRNNSTETIENELTTYEIFSSDEVKNISSYELNKSTKQESDISNSNINSEHKVIDLTQDESTSPVQNEISFTLNQSKSIVEIDLFAQSPLQEEHNPTDFNSYPELYNSTDSNSYHALSNNMAENTNDMIAFTLNLETNGEQSKSEKDDFSIISTSPGNKNQKNDFKVVGNNEMGDVEDDIVLRDISFQQTSSTFFNFERSKQLETQTQTEKQVFKDAITGNDTIFQELCDKYLNKIKNTTSELKKQNTDFVKSFSQSYNNFTMDFDITVRNNLEQKTSCERSFTQPIHKMKSTPQKSINYTNFSMDFEMSRDNNLSLTRKSTSFTVKTPQKTNLDFNTFPKSYSFKDDHFNESIDLTQEHEEDTGDADIVDEDDDCLILSDDEINYSIWQANKTSNFQNSEQSDIENDIISLPDVDQSSDEEIKQLKSFRKAEIEAQPVEKSYSAFDISNYKNVSTKGRANKNINFQTSQQSDIEVEVIDLPDNDHSSDKDFSKIENSEKYLAKEDSYSDFEILTSKYKTSKELSQEDLKFDRSEFGILEEYSQTINFTPTKELTEALFLSSPTEKSEPMKVFGNYHSSSQKFQNLLNLVDGKSPPYVDALDDFDEFDRLVYTSPSKTKKTLANKPQGIEKLLTAEISFTQEASVSKNTAKQIVSPTILTSDAEEVKYNNKTYTVRYVNSPKPDFTQLCEAELLKQLYNFGIKPLKRKQAVKILEYIYNQTHPILKDERVENNGSVTQANKLNVGENYDNTFGQPCTSKSFLNSNSLAISDSSGNENNMPNSIKGGHDLTEAVNSKLNLHDSGGQQMLRYADVLSAELCDENYILQTNVTKKTPRPLLPFHIAWYNLICSNPKLHETILMYEPIDLQEIYVFLKGLGYRYDPKDLKTFFDRRCIIFRYDLMPATKDVNRHVRKSKRSDKIKR